MRRKLPAEAPTRLAGKLAEPVDLLGNILPWGATGCPTYNDQYAVGKTNQGEKLLSSASLKHPLLTSLTLCQQAKREILRAQLWYHKAEQWRVDLGAEVLNLEQLAHFCNRLKTPFPSLNTFYTCVILWIMIICNRNSLTTKAEKQNGFYVSYDGSIFWLIVHMLSGFLQYQMLIARSKSKECHFRSIWKVLWDLIGWNGAISELKLSGRTLLPHKITSTAEVL